MVAKERTCGGMVRPHNLKELVDLPTYRRQFQLFLRFVGVFIVFLIDANTLSQFYGYRTLF